MIIEKEQANEIKNRVIALDWQNDNDGMPAIRVDELFAVLDFMVFDTFPCIPSC